MYSMYSIVLTPVFLAQSYQGAGGRFCIYWKKLENTTLPFQVRGNRTIGGSQVYEILSILVQPLYILVTRQGKCRRIWLPVGAAEPALCVKSGLEAEKRHWHLVRGWCLNSCIVRKNKWLCNPVPVTTWVVISNLISLNCCFCFPYFQLIAEIIFFVLWWSYHTSFRVPGLNCCQFLLMFTFFVFLIYYSLIGKKDTPVSVLYLLPFLMCYISKLIWLAHDEFLFVRFWTKNFSGSVRTWDGKKLWFFVSFFFFLILDF